MFELKGDTPVDIKKRLSISYYKNIADIGGSDHVHLVRHQETGKIFVKKILSIYNRDVYKQLKSNPVKGVPKIIDYYEEDDKLTLIEEYISGVSLWELIEEKKISMDDMIRYVLELCDIVGRLHDLTPPLIHRDIKPQNIIISSSDSVFLIDFNASKHYSPGETCDTVLMGTEGFAAPEQYGFGASSSRTDIYGIGKLMKISFEELGIEPGTTVYAPVIAQCTNLVSQLRYNSTDELKAALIECRDGKHLSLEIPPEKARLLPPGFRTFTTWKILLASTGYILAVSLCTQMEFKNVSSAELIFDRILCFLMLMGIILISSDYLNVQRLFPLCKKRNKWVKILGIVVFDLIYVLFLLAIMVAVSPLFN